MSKRKNSDDIINPNKHQRLSYEQNVLNTLFGNLPNELILGIMDKMDIIDLWKLRNAFPFLSDYTCKIKFTFDVDQKNKLIKKGFSSRNIDIIKYLFETVEYSNIDDILISFKTFESIVAFCVHTNSFNIIDFLIEWFENHWIKYQNYYLIKYFKKQIDSTLSQFLDHLTYCYNQNKHNHTSILELAIVYTFKYNNLILFDYILYKYNSKYTKKHYKVFASMEEHNNFIFERDNYLMLEKYLELMEKNTEAEFINANYLDLYYQSIESNRLNCLKLLLKKFKLSIDTIIDDVIQILDNNKFECFDIIYNYNKEMFTQSVLEEILEHINPDNIDALIFISNIEGFLDTLKNKDLNLFLVLMLNLDINQTVIFKLIETFGNSKYIKFESLTHMEKNLIDTIKDFAFDITTKPRWEIFKESSIKLSLIHRIKQNY